MNHRLNIYNTLIEHAKRIDKSKTKYHKNLINQLIQIKKDKQDYEIPLLKKMRREDVNRVSSFISNSYVKGGKSHII